MLFLTPFLVGRVRDPTKIDKTEKSWCQLILASLLEDVVAQPPTLHGATRDFSHSPTHPALVTQAVPSPRHARDDFRQQLPKSAVGERPIQLLGRERRGIGGRRKQGDTARSLATGPQEEGQKKHRGLGIRRRKIVGRLGQDATILLRGFSQVDNPHLPGKPRFTLIGNGFRRLPAGKLLMLTCTSRSSPFENQACKSIQILGFDSKFLSATGSVFPWF